MGQRAVFGRSGSATVSAGFRLRGAHVATTGLPAAFMQTYPWIIAVVALLLLSASLTAWIWRSTGQQERVQALPGDWDVAARPVFSAAERRLYRALREALPHHVLIPKLALVRFCQPTDPNEATFWHRLLGTTQVSFAICSENGRVLTAIDLESDRSPTRRESEIKRSVLGACRVRYLRCAADQLPTAAELQWLVPRATAASLPPASVTMGRSAAAVHDIAPAAPSAPIAAAGRPFWEDPPVFQDSFFGVDTRFDSSTHADALPPSVMAPLHRNDPLSPSPLMVEPMPGAPRRSSGPGVRVVTGAAPARDPSDDLRLDDDGLGSSRRRPARRTSAVRR